MAVQTDTSSSAVTGMRSINTQSQSGCLRKAEEADDAWEVQGCPDDSQWLLKASKRGPELPGESITDPGVEWYLKRLRPVWLEQKEG